MGVKLYFNQQLTGLTLSGVSDGSGVWNTVDFNAQLTGLPSDAVGVLLRVGIESSSPYWVGVRTTGKTTPIYQASLANRGQKYFFAPFAAGTKNLDIYLQSASAVFSVVAVLDATWHFFDIDAGLQNITGTGSTSTYAARTATGCPADSVIIMDGVRARPIGATGAISNTPVGMQVMKLDSSSQFEIATSTNTTKVYGYCDSTETAFSTWMSTTEAYTADSTWRTAAYTAGAGKKLLSVFVDKGTASLDVQLRATGSSFTRSTVGASDNVGFVGVSESGNFDYLLETTTAGSMYITAQFADYETYAANIVSIDQLIAGEISTVTFSAAFVATQFAISDGTTTKIATATATANPLVYTFVCPDWVNGETGLFYGSVSIVATDGSASTGAFAATYSPPDGYSYVPAGVVSYYNYGAASTPPYSPELVEGTQARFISSHVTIGTDLQLTSIFGFSGTTRVGDINPTSRIVRLDSVIIDGEVIPPQDDYRGPTAIGLTAAGLTMVGLTATGL